MLDRYDSINRAGFQRAMLRIVALKMVLVSTTTPPICPARPRRMMHQSKPGVRTTTRFPFIHPFAEVCVFAFDKDGLARFEKILLGGEEVVVG